MSLRDKQPKSGQLLKDKRREMKDAGRVEGHITEQQELLQAEHKQLEIDLLAVGREVP